MNSTYELVSWVRVLGHGKRISNSHSFVVSLLVARTAPLVQGYRLAQTIHPPGE